MIRFGVAHDRHINRHGIDLLFQQWDPGVAEFGVAGVDQGGALTPHQKAL